MPLTREKAQLMSASEIDRTLVRLAHEILEKTKNLDKLAFIGIRRRGVPLAQRLAKKIEALENRQVPTGILDITFYRDDLSTVDTKPVVNPTTEIPFEVAGLDIPDTHQAPGTAAVDIALDANAHVKTAKLAKSSGNAKTDATAVDEAKSGQYKFDVGPGCRPKPTTYQLELTFH